MLTKHGMAFSEPTLAEMASPHISIVTEHIYSYVFSLLGLFPDDKAITCIVWTELSVPSQSRELVAKETHS